MGKLDVRARGAKAPRAVSEIDLHLAAFIRKARWDARMSQAEVADKLNISIQQLQKYEVGRNRIAAGRLFEICCAMGVSINEAFAGLPIARAR